MLLITQSLDMVLDSNAQTWSKAPRLFFRKSDILYFNFCNFSKNKIINYTKPLVKIFDIK
jgi:hypothetical protein